MCIATILSAAMLLLNAGILLGDDISWTGASTGNPTLFSDSDNWNPQQVPIAGDTAIFDLYDTYYVDMGNETTNHNCYFLNGEFEFNLSYMGGDVTYTLTNEFVVGRNSGDTTDVSMARGCLETVNAYIGQEEGACGMLQLNDITMNVSDLLGVGNAGDGNLFIYSGAEVNTARFQVGTDDSAMGYGYTEIAGSDASLTVTGEEFWVGNAGTGHMEIYDGATVEMAHEEGIKLGCVAGGDGEILVEGEDSMLKATGVSTAVKGIYVGLEGNGTITVTDGGTVKTTDGSGWIGIGCGSDAVGVINVYDFGTLETENAPIVVGASGTGTLNVEGFSTATSSGELFVAGGTGSIGDVLVSDCSQYISNSGFKSKIGDAGTGTLTIKNESLVQAGRMIIGVQSTGNGTVTLDLDDSSNYDSPILKISHSLMVGQRGVGLLDVNDGRVALGNADPTTVPDGEVHIGTGATLRGTGTIEANRVVNISGEIGPGGTDNQWPYWPPDPDYYLPGILTINGVYEQQAGGTLYIEIGGTDRGVDYSALVVNNDVTLAGTLTVELTEGFQPQEGCTFDILDWGNTITGAFVLDLPALSYGSWDTSNLYINGEIEVVPEPATLMLLSIGGLAALRRGRKSRV